MNTFGQYRHAKCIYLFIFNIMAVAPSCSFFSLGMYFTDSKLSCMAIPVQTNWESSLKRALEKEVSSRGGHFKWKQERFLAEVGIT